MFRPTNAIRKLINDRASEADIRYAARQAGMVLLREDALEKVRNGVTSPDEVLRVVQVDETEIPCPACKAIIEADFATCPYCSTSLKASCAGCGQPLRREWKVCPHCNTAAKAQPVVLEPGRTDRRPAPAPSEPGEAGRARGDRAVTGDERGGDPRASNRCVRRGRNGHASLDGGRTGFAGDGGPGPGPG